VFPVNGGAVDDGFLEMVLVVVGMTGGVGVVDLTEPDGVEGFPEAAADLRAILRTCLVGLKMRR
jgi:hypothetical protein